MIRVLRFAAVALIPACLLAIPFMKSAAVSSNPTVSVIVELRSDPAAVYAAKAKQQGALVSDEQMRTYRNGLTAAQDQFMNALRSQGVNFQLQTVNVKDASGNVAGSVPMRYTLVYNGVTLSVPEASLPAIAGMSAVKAIHANSVKHPDLTKSLAYIRATELYGSNPNNFTPFATFPDGNQGQGVYIAVIDTGIDWTHPMFGGDPTPPRLGIAPNSASVPSNQKVVYQLPLADIVTDGFGHGTHVASEAAGYLATAPGLDAIPGTADDVNIHGVAPQAKLMSYKVCSDTLSTVGSASGAVGGCLNSSIIMAIEDAVSPQTVDLQPKPIANVINMSLGGGGGPDDPGSVAADNATLLGASVVAAAGNEGPGEATVGSPGAGRRVISPGADNDPAVGNNTIDVVDGSRNGMNAFLMGGSASITANITQNYVFCGLGETPADFPAAVAGKIALIQRGSTVEVPANPGNVSAGTGLFAVKVGNAAAAGAIAAIVYNNTDGEITAVTTYKTIIPALGLSKANGEFLKSIIGSNLLGASAKQIRINKATVFTPSMADFSSRGPVQGYGQIKPDISAPGVDVLAAVPPASAIAALGLGAQGVNYAAISGTSMATPHTAGSVALIRQAHPDWTPDMIRTALINTATNLRDANQGAKADGASADSIIAQGGGLIDVYHAVNAKALMGATEDDGKGAFLLGSHSYGEVPVVNNRVTSTQSVTVTVRDLSGQGGTYNVSVANNRDLQLEGISVAASAPSVSVPAGGTATFTVNTTFDGNLIRDPNTVEVNGTAVTFRPIQLQWYVTARRADGAESLRMPFYYKPIFSRPALSSVDTATYSGTVAVGDGGAQALSGISYVDVPFPVSDATFNLDATLDFMQVVTGAFADLDFTLLDPDGNVVTDSTQPGGPEHISCAITRAGTYVYRVSGFLAANEDFTITSKQSQGHSAVPPSVQNPQGEYANLQGQQVDFDGSFNLSWLTHGGEEGFEIEHSSDGDNWQSLADVAGQSASFAVTNQPNGLQYFRVRAIFPGQIGKFVTDASNVVSILVDQRSKVDITSLVNRAISNVSLSGGVFQLDLAMTNNSATAYVPQVDLNVVGINSASHTVKVSNADNAKDGTSQTNAASFGYSQKIGSDEIFTPSEVTSPRTLRFQDNASELFTFDAVVTAYLSTGNSSPGSSSGSSGQPPSSSPGAGNILPLTQLRAVLRFTANPLTRTVTAQLVSLR